MRIAVEARYLLTREKTGVENYTYFLLSALAGLEGEHELHLYLHRRPREEESDMLGPFLSSPRSHFQVVPGLRLWLKLWMPLAARLQRADVGLFPGSILPFYLPFPGVMVVYDLCWASHPEYYPEREIRIFREVYPRSLAAARLVFAVSEWTKHDLKRIYHTPADKIRVVPCGREAAFSRVANAAEQARIVWGLEPGFILAVGTAHPRKDIAALLRAYALCSQRQTMPLLVLTGPGGPASAPLQKLAGNLEIASRVRWLGYVPRGQLPLLYSAAGVFAMPSRYEGFGLPVLEAMACGTPVVCSNTSALPEVAGEAALLVEPGRPEILAESLLRLLTDKRLAEELRKKGEERAKDFDWKRSARLALSYLREACAR